MPELAATICKAMKQSAAANGMTALAASGRANFLPPSRNCWRPIAMRSRRFNPDGKLAIYPGSPLLIRHWLRPQDRLIACELETGAAQALARHLRNDPLAKAVTIDGWTALNAYIPPKEKRGLVLIDPPYEQRDELKRLADALAAAHRKWSTGIFLAWYPIKDLREIAAFIRTLERSRHWPICCASSSFAMAPTTADCAAPV